jgi:hypothetical protein
MPEVQKPLKETCLEERIERILCVPNLELDGNAYKGKYELNNGLSIKNFILNKLRLNEKGENISYTNQSTGSKIIISNNSAGKIALHWKDGETYQKSIAYIPHIIESMQFLEEMKANKENAKYNKYSYYITPVRINGEPCTILSTIGLMENEIYYDQNLFEGTPEEIFAEAKNSTSEKYSRLNCILKNVE